MRFNKDAFSFLFPDSSRHVHYVTTRPVFDVFWWVQRISTFGFLFSAYVFLSFPLAKRSKCWLGPLFFLSKSLVKSYSPSIKFLARFLRSYWLINYYLTWHPKFSEVLWTNTCLISKTTVRPTNLSPPSADVYFSGFSQRFPPWNLPLFWSTSTKGKGVSALATLPSFNRRCQS